MMKLTPQLKLLVTTLALGLLVTACASQSSGQRALSDTGSWSSDVIGVEEMQLSADYWVNKIDQPDQVLESPAGISVFDKDAFSNDKNMIDLEQFPAKLSGGELRDMILSMSKPYGSDLYGDDDELLSDAGYAAYLDNLNLEQLPEDIDVHFGMVVERTSMRTWPTDDRYFKTLDSKNLDRFQENGLFPADAVAVLHKSLDGEWLFVQSYNYAAWVRKEAIAIGERQQVLDYKKAADFLVITGDKVFTTFNPDVPGVSEVQLEMGIRLPLLKNTADGQAIGGQNPYTSYIVELPIRNADGKLEIEKGLIPRNKDVNVGFLPYTRANLTQQAFKFLGERYGWGHSYNARDCTGFVSEVYKTFGYYLPRNSGQQGSSALGENTRFTETSSSQDKLEAFEKMDTGDLIYIPGHVMMFIANENGDPYVIHDVSGLSYFDQQNNLYVGVLNGVSVTPLLPLQLNDKTSYVDRIYNIKRIR
jgi:hypothetical protein